MVVISKTILQAFIGQHPSIKNALNKWYEDTKAADWKNFSELKRTFNSADSVGNDRYVFDIKGNQFRIVALIVFKVRTVFVLFVGTHQEYDNIKANSVTFKK